MAKLRISIGLCIAVAITAVTLQLMMRYESNKQRDLLLADAESTRDLVLHDLRLRIRAIDRMAARLATFETFEEDVFELEAASYLRDMPGFFAIAWVDLNGVLSSAQPEASQRLKGKSVADFGEDRRILLDLASRSSAFELSPPVKLRTGQNAGLLGAKAVRRGVNQIGTIWVVFQSDDWINNLHFGLRQSEMRDKPMSVYLNGRNVFVSSGFKALDTRIIEAPPLRVGGQEVIVQVKEPVHSMVSHQYTITWVVTFLVGVLSISSLIAVLALRASRVLEKRAAQANTALTETNEKMQLEVTQRRSAELEAKRSSAAKSQFLSTMSHELRTPMNGVLGMTELLCESGLTEEQRPYADDLSRASEQLMTVLSDILDFSNLDRSAVVLSPEALNVQELISSVVQLFVPMAEKKGLAINLKISPNVPQYVVIDRVRLRQIVINLIRNAIKFTQKGEISVHLGATGRRDKFLTLSVKDTGVGIPAQKLQDIFTEFRQADSDVARQFDGAGLGLSIVDRLSKAMGGQTHVTSEVGVGSEFSIRLPLVVPQGDDVPETEAAEAPSGATSLASARVLVAEDNLTNQRIVAGFLKGAGCVLDIANDGQEAVDLFCRQSYDAVLMDVSMPNKNGYEATQTIRNIERHRLGASCPIIGFTANCGDEDQIKCREAGMDDVLAKPASKHELSARLEHWLSRGSEKGAATHSVA